MWHPEELVSEGLLTMGDKARIREVSVRAEWDPCDRVASLDIRVAIQDDRDSATDRAFVRAVVEAPDGEFLTAGGSRLIAEVPLMGPRTSCAIRLRRPIRGPVLWDALTPRWYKLLLILEDSRGDILDIKAGQFGIAGPGLCDIEVRGVQAGVILLRHPRPVWPIPRHRIGADVSQTASEATERMVRRLSPCAFQAASPPGNP